MFIILLGRNTVKDTPVEKELFFWYIPPVCLSFLPDYLVNFVNLRNRLTGFFFFLTFCYIDLIFSIFFHDIDFTDGCCYNRLDFGKSFFLEVLHVGFCHLTVYRFYGKRVPPVGHSADLRRRLSGVFYGRHRRRRWHHLRAHLSDCLQRPAHVLRPGHQQALRRHRHGVLHRPVHQKRLCGLEAVRPLHRPGPAGVHGRHLAAAPHAGRGAEIPAADRAAGGGLCHVAEPRVARRAR